MLKLAGPVNCKLFACSPHSNATLADKQKHLPTFVRMCIKLCRFLNYARPSRVCVSHIMRQVWCQSSGRGARVQGFYPWLYHCVISDEVLSLSVSQFPHMYNEDKSAYPPGLMRITCILRCSVLSRMPAATTAGRVCSISLGYGWAGRGHQHILQGTATQGRSRCSCTLQNSDSWVPHTARSTATRDLLRKGRVFPF